MWSRIWGQGWSERKCCVKESFVDGGERLFGQRGRSCMSLCCTSTACLSGVRAANVAAEVDSGVLNENEILETAPMFGSRFRSLSHLYDTLTVNSRRCTLWPHTSHSPGCCTDSSVTVASGGMSYLTSLV